MFTQVMALTGSTVSHTLYTGSEERLKLLILFSCSRYPKLSLSVSTDQLAPSGLIACENDSLGIREPENENDNFVRCLIGRATLNRMMKCDV